MGELIIISALAKNNCIGKDGDIPWRLREDFQHFQENTMGHPCIMGDKTFDSLPDNARPLPGRENVVLSLDPEYAREGAVVFNSIESGLAHVKDKEKAFICGGASIYKLLMPYADKLILTHIDKEFEGDTFFPEVNKDEWEVEDVKEGKGVNRNDGEELTFRFTTYRRKPREEGEDIDGEGREGGDEE